MKDSLFNIVIVHLYFNKNILIKKLTTKTHNLSKTIFFNKKTPRSLKRRKNYNFSPASLLWTSGGDVFTPARTRPDVLKSSSSVK